MKETKRLLETIIEGLQVKKGKKIVTIDLTEIQGSICDFFVVCEGNTTTQVSALSDSVWDVVADQLKIKPLGAIGMQEAQWVAMDYGSIIVHIFLPDLRAYYKLENLWADARITEIPDIL